MPEEPSDRIVLKFIPRRVVAVLDGSRVDEFLHVEMRQPPQRCLEAPAVDHPRAALRFGLAAGSAFLAAAFSVFALPPAPSMLRRSASMRLTTLAGRVGAFSFGAGCPA